MKTCAHCGGAVNPRGRRSRDGSYYCQDVDCHAERNRVRARRYRRPLRQPEVVSCCVCQGEMLSTRPPSFDGNRYCQQLSCRSVYQRRWRSWTLSLDGRAVVRL